MKEKVKVMVMGGHTKGFHDFDEMAPIFRAESLKCVDSYHRLRNCAFFSFAFAFLSLFR